MARHRSFTTGNNPSEPVTFDIDGETFTCVDSMPGSVLLEHTRRLTSDDVSVATGELLDMWSDVLDDEPGTDEHGNPTVSEHDRFRTFIDDPARRVDVQLLGQILQYVLGELARRPTDAPSPSAPGQSPNGATSEQEHWPTVASRSPNPSTR